MWEDFIKQEQAEKYFKNLSYFLEQERQDFAVYPPEEDVFNAFKYTPYDQVKVVILGQDVYHNPGEAHGLAFSVRKGIKVPPSLKNIFKELKADLNIDSPNHGDLTGWAEQGVLLLNSALTVRKNEPGSHQNSGWQVFTNKVISLLNEKTTPIVFILWGNFAKQKKTLITNCHHLILESAHPSPLSAYNGFFGSKPFSKTNDFLIKNNQKAIDWIIHV